MGPWKRLKGMNQSLRIHRSFIVVSASVKPTTCETKTPRHEEESNVTEPRRTYTQHNNSKRDDYSAQRPCEFLYLGS